MSTLEIFTHDTSSSKFLDVTEDILAILRRWDTQSFIPGDALCCVTAVSANAQVLVNASKPRPGDYIFDTSIFADKHEIPVEIDIWDFNKVWLRTSEIFMIRGPTILADRRIYVHGDGAPCNLAVALL